MIKFLKYNEIDFTKYQQCLKNAEQYKYCAEKTFLDITSEKCWNLLVYKDYEAVMPLPFIKKFGLSFIVNPKLCQQLGIFSEKDDVQVNDLFLDYFQKKFKIWYYAFNDSNAFSKNLKQRKNFIISADLYENVQQKYSPKRKRKLRLDPQVLELSEVVENLNFQDAADFIEQNMLGAGTENNKKDFIRIFKDLSSNNTLLFYAFKYQSRIISIIAIHDNPRSVALLGTFNDRDYVKLAGASLLIDRAIKNYIHNRSFDFEGSEIPSVEEFFRGFRPELKPYKIIQNTKKQLIKKLFFL